MLDVLVLEFLGLWRCAENACCRYLTERGLGWCVMNNTYRPFNHHKGITIITIAPHHIHASALS